MISHLKKFPDPNRHLDGVLGPSSWGTQTSASSWTESNGDMNNTKYKYMSPQNACLLHVELD